MNIEKWTKTFGIVWAIGVLTSLGIAGVVTWAIIKLVMKYG